MYSFDVQKINSSALVHLGLSDDLVNSMCNLQMVSCHSKLLFIKKLGHFSEENFPPTQTVSCDLDVSIGGNANV